jgi:hypothetical protein
MGRHRRPRLRCRHRGHRRYHQPRQCQRPLPPGPRQRRRDLRRLRRLLGGQRHRLFHRQGHRHHADAARRRDLGAAPVVDAAGKPLAPAGNTRNTEWAGPVFSPDGRVLFVNLYNPGITLAITGPWTKGTL